MVKVGRTFLCRDAGWAEGGGKEVDAFGTPRMVSVVVLLVDEWAEGKPNRSRPSSWITSSALPKRSSAFVARSLIVMASSSSGTSGSTSLGRGGGASACRMG